MTIQHQPFVTKAYLRFPYVCKQHEQRLDWIATERPRQQAPTFVFHSHMLLRLCRLLKPKRFQALLPLHGQCAHWKKLHVSQKNTYLHCAASASEIATSQTIRKYKGTQGGQKIQPGGQPQLCPSLESPISSPRWTSLWQPGSTDLCIFASTHPCTHVSLYPCVHSSCKVQGREHGWPSANGHVCGEHSSPLSSPRGLPSSLLLASLSSHSTCRATVPDNRLQKRGK